MSMKSIKYDLDVRDIIPVIEEVIKRLPNSNHRFLASKFPLNHVCLDGFCDPTFEERLLSNFNQVSGNEEIVKQFYEEIKMIEKIMEEMNLPNNPDLQARDRKAYAMQIWDCYAIPWRYYNKSVYIIWSPHDLYGTPIINCYSVPHFLTVLAEIMEKRNERIYKQSRHLKAWIIIGVLAFILAALVLSYFSYGY